MGLGIQRHHSEHDTLCARLLDLVRIPEEGEAEDQQAGEETAEEKRSSHRELLRGKAWPEGRLSGECPCP